MFVLHVESIKNTHIYRKLHVPKMLYFVDLQYAIRLVFDLLELKIEQMYFIVIRKNAAPIQSEIITYKPSHIHHAMEDTRLADYFLQQQDEVQLLINDTIKLHIIVENIVASSKPKIECLEGAGELLTEQPNILDLQQLNEALFSINEAMSIELSRKPSEMVHVEMNDIEKMHYKRKPMLSMALEFDLNYSAETVSTLAKGDNMQSRPLELLLMDGQTGEVIANDFFPVLKAADTCQTIFFEVLQALPNRLGRVYVTKEMKPMLEPLTKILSIELVASELPMIEEYRIFRENNLRLDE